LAKFWLEDVISRSGIPYPIFFTVLSIPFYLIGIPLMSVTGNLSSFLSEPKWIFLVIYGIVSGMLVIFVYRKFHDSLSDIKHLISSESEFKKLRDKLFGYLSDKIYWVFVVFWPVMNITRLFEPTAQQNWWWFYHHPFLITLYYIIVGLPTWIFGGMFIYMIPFGLTLAYRELCLKTSFKVEVLSVEWMAPFKGFKNLITVSMLFAVLISILGILIWAPTLRGTSYIYAPYFSMAVILIPTIVFPHYFFHKLFSRVKENRLRAFESDLVKLQNQKKDETMREILLLLRKGEVEKMKTWLFDVKILVEIIIVALMHVILIEVLTTIIH
jgi:hypothetical protein